MILRLILLVIIAAPFMTPAQAQETLPEPHLGYGLHLDPNLPVDPAMVDQMGMDWVKLYADHQIAQFTGKRILFREDIRWTNDWNALKNHITQRAQRLSSLGVDAMEIHNEPNLGIEWSPRPNAWEYVQVLRVAYQAIKAVAPNMIVVSGGLAPTITTPDRQAITDIDFAREMLENGAARWFDAFGYHPYGYNAPPEEAPNYNKLNFRRAELIWALFEEYGITGKQIWMTEFGWLRDPAEDGVNCADSDPDFFGFAWLRVSGQTQADYIVRAFAYADRNWEWTGPMFLWNLNFSMRDGTSLSTCNHQRWFGLLRRDGSPTPAFQAVVNMPKRYSRYLPALTLQADAMTVEVNAACPGTYPVGSFTVLNSGYPGSFSTSIEPAAAPFGPLVTVTPTAARSGDVVQVNANTAGLQAGVYLVYINVRATIGGELTAQNIRGFVIVQDSMGSCL